MSTVGVWEVELVRQILDVYLKAQVVGEIVIRCRIDTSVARQYGAVVVVYVTAALVSKAQTQSALICHLQIVPEREHVLR